MMRTLKIKSFALALAATLSAASATAATEIVNGITWYYTVDCGMAKIGSGSTSVRAVPTSTTGAITIPSKLGGYPVQVITRFAFHNCTGITSVTIPSSVWSIADQAFLSCSGLTSVSMTYSVTRIGDNAFQACKKLASINISPCVTTIGSQVFENCGFSTFTIPSNVTRIGEGAFALCKNLTSVTIPSSVQYVDSQAFAICPKLSNVTIGSGVSSIGSYAFYECYALARVDFEGAPPDGLANSYIQKNAAIRYNEKYESQWLPIIASCGFTNAKAYSVPLEDGGPYTETVDGVAWTFTVANGGAFVGNNGAVAIPTSTSGNVKVPDQLGLHPVVQINSYAFSGCSSVVSISFPNTITNIKKRAFNYCSSLRTVVFPSSLQYLDNAAFRYASNVTNITFLGNAPYVDSSTFKDPSPAFTVTIKHGSSGWDDDGDGRWKDRILCYYREDTFKRYCDALDTDTELRFDDDGGREWIVDTSTAYYNGQSLKSCYVYRDSASYIEAKIVGPKFISFWWKVSSEPICDKFSFIIDGTTVSSISGTGSSWQRYSTSIGTGEHTIRWQYSKDSDDIKGSDCGWIDCLNIMNPTPSTISTAASWEYLPEQLSKPLVISNDWLIAKGLAAPGDSVALASATIAATGKNGIPRYQSYILNMEPDSNVPAEEQLEVTIDGFDANGVPIINYKPTPNDASHVTIKKLGRKTLPTTGDTNWSTVNGDENNYNFFKISVEVK